MVRALFQGIERSLGPGLAHTSLLVYWGGLILLALAVCVPLVRIWLDYALARIGLAQYWVMTCGQCGKRSLVLGRSCGECGRDLGIPWPVRLWTSLPGRRESVWARRLRWAGHLLGSTAFLLLSIWMVTATGALAPRGQLARLFLGCALLAWAMVGWFGGRAMRLAARGIVARAGDLLVGLAALGLMSVALFLADVARPVPEIPLVRFVAVDTRVRVADRLLPLSEGEIGVEYLQVEQELMGYRRIIPLALVGAERLPFPRGMAGQWLVNHLRRQADRYTARGLVVRLRSERLRVTAGQAYEVIRRDGQLIIRRVADSPAGEK
jgi:hypothetical protein